MTQTLINVFFIAMTPIGELRAAIPYGIYHLLHPLAVYLVAIAGNMVPVAFLLLCLPRFEKAGLKLLPSQAHRLYLWFKERTRRKHSRAFKRFGALALVIFVAIPLPLTGAWSGALASYIFNIPPKSSFFLIFLGVLIAGGITLFTSMGIFS